MGDVTAGSVPVTPVEGAALAEPALRVRPADEVRALIALRFLGAHHDPAPLGDVMLMPHQWDAVLRLDAMLAQSGGALLADDAGLGKTYVALALAARRGGALVVAPASLRAMWEASAARARVPVRVVSIESLGRGVDPAGPEPLVIVDEAHHARNRHTRRWQRLARRCATTPVLLLSATPLHNRRREVATQLALFLGARAFALTPEELARHVVRRTRGAVRLDHPLPALDGPHWLTLAARDDLLLERILALPLPCPPADGGRAGALLQWTLVRQWSSSRAAFLGALRRRLALAIAMRASLERGVLPTRHDLAAWACAEGAMQLAFPELLAGGESPPDEPALLLPAVIAHEEAVAALLHDASRGPDHDRARAELLRVLRARHPGARIIAFAERAETVERLWQLLRHLPGVAMLTSRGGVVAGGAIPRRELLARVASAPASPGAGSAVRGGHRAEAVSLLLTTDLLSEGANLQEASVVVHLDLPWSPARMEQRVGRVRRIGSPHLMVTSYAIRPPASTERLLQVERRLREKLRAAARAIGVAGSILPGPVAVEPKSAPERWADVHEHLARWRVAWRGDAGAIDASPGPTGATPPAPTPVSAGAGPAPPLVACVAAARGGGVALVEREDEPTRLLAVDARGRVDDSAASVAAALVAASGAGSPCADSSARLLLRAVRHALHRGQVAGSIGIGGGAGGLSGGGGARHRLHRALIARIERSLSAAPRHERAALLPLAAASRAALAAGTSAGVERVLGELLASQLPPAAWLRAFAAFAETSSRAVPSAARAGSDDERVTALLVFIPSPPRAGP